MRRLLLIAALVALLGACSTAGKHAGTTNPVEPAFDPNSSMDPDFAKLQIIDAHTHTEFDGHLMPETGVKPSEEEYFKELKEAHAVAAIAHTYPGWTDYHDYRARNVFHCYGSGPHPDLKFAEAGLKSHKFACIKVYLGYIHQWASDPHYRPLYKLAEKYDVPVVFHTGDTVFPWGKLKYADPLTIDEVAVDFPKVRFVIAHCGNPWIESAAEVAYKNANVYLDASALEIGDMDLMPPTQVYEYVTKPVAWVFGYVENPKKLMFGSDYPLNHIAPYARAVARGIPKEYWKDVFHDNAVRVFKLKLSPGVMQ